jgi:hypothetical protein
MIITSVILLEVGTTGFNLHSTLPDSELSKELVLSLSKLCQKPQKVTLKVRISFQLVESHSAVYVSSTTRFLSKKS